MVTRSKKPTVANVRLTSEDQKIADALMKKLGMTTVSQLVRQAFRALAVKEGIAT